MELPNILFPCLSTQSPRLSIDLLASPLNLTSDPPHLASQVFDGMTHTRYTIAVGSVGRDARHASYSTAGAAIFISAPGGDSEFSSNHVVAQVRVAPFPFECLRIPSDSF